MRYIGFDVGDGESAIAAFEQGSGIEPAILPVGGSRSFLSAVGMLNGEIGLYRRAGRRSQRPFQKPLYL